MANIIPIHENIKHEKLYKFHGLLWQPIHSVTHTTGHEYDHVEGTPYCPKCKAKLSFVNDSSLLCELCNSNYNVTPSLASLAQLASVAYNAKLKEGWKVESLDLPPGAIKDENENDDFWVEARLGQKDGKLIAIIYFGDKKKKEDGKKAYSQVFLDIDDEQMRFDKTNKNPLEIIAKLKAEFINSTHTSDKK